ncbi:ATP-binding protein [Candidatus Woesearchaeota archaeon]|nr:ATP-binding protein [Candidatus Woesearchaeota archaeon]
MAVKGQVISGEFGKIIVRQKHGETIELGELLIGTAGYDKVLMQAYDLSYGSQISRQNLELMSGMKMEQENDLEFYEPELRNYKLTMLKSVLVIKNNCKDAVSSKTLPDFFSFVSDVKKQDMRFFSEPKNPLSLGNLRSGSKVLDLDISVEGDKVLSEHILVPATTGRGKSNLTKCLIWNTIDKEYCAMLVLDPHDEYYGRNELGMKDHPEHKNVIYYSQNPPPGCMTLKINLRKILPWHFNGVASWTDAQSEAMSAYYKKYKEKWIEAVLFDKEVKGFMDGTLGVLKRRLLSLLNIDVNEGNTSMIGVSEGDKARISSKGVFSASSGESTVTDIVDSLEKARTVIIDTSGYSGSVEILIGSIISTEILNRYRSYKVKGSLDDKPVISIVLEEAPRVLGKEVLEKGSNIFATIAREGRKFKTGLYAITQLPSLIPRQILANMNTKIILGIEMAPERQAVIDSASQDLSDDNRNIASLDKGEAVVTSNFTKFAIPLKVPLFKRVVEKSQNEHNRNSYYSGATGEQSRAEGTAESKAETKVDSKADSKAKVFADSNAEKKDYPGIRFG